MNRRKGLRDRWLPHALNGHTGAGFGCRLMLTVMYFRMTEKGYVSIPRTELADILGVDTRQITRWIRKRSTLVCSTRWEAGTAGGQPNMPPLSPA